MHFYKVFNKPKQYLSWVLFPFDIFEFKKILRIEAATIFIDHTRIKLGVTALVKYPIVSKGSAEIALVQH